ncbi:MAG TPA: DUF4922 domain-containing protein [Phycisphaerae bacterium]|nr:DUF4922 domain-containing protein [Phycisphaerae bacterium]HRR85402.1 DUF4922 domain-containing protein [Phycisphaerae bacterium]
MDKQQATGPGELAYQLSALWQRQTETWEMLAEGLAALRQARTRTFHVNGWRVTAQCNPARIKSSGAKVDAESLAQRPCFLCTENRPVAQASVPYRDRWLILCNPAPLFEPHYTVAWIDHEPQRVGPAIEGLLSMSRDLDGRYTVFYNGPASGASAPDHLHLQAARAGALPFETQLATQLAAGDPADGQRRLEWVRDDPVRIAVTRPGSLPVIVLMGDSKDAMAASLREVVIVLGEVRPVEPEPMLNLFATYTEERWVTWLFPRGAHRPRFYGTGEDDFLISPGAADLAGIVVSPRPRDFERLTDEIMQTIFREALLPPESFAEVRDLLARKGRR